MEPAAAGQALWRRWLWSWALKGPILGELEGKGKMTGSLGSEANVEGGEQHKRQGKEGLQ